MRAAEWMTTVPWCMTEQALEAMLSIAQRQPVDDAAQRMHGPTSLELRAGAKRDDSRRMTMRDGVALIHIDGPIYRYADFFSEVSGGVTTEALARDLQLALDDPRVEAILIVIDSPGGEATAIGELSQAIYAGRTKKPIWSYIEGYGASAAYWLASAAERVVVDPSALLGSIGTVMAVANPAARPQPARSIDVVSTQSPKKRLDPTTQAGRDELQRIVDAMTDVFIAAVERNRGLSREQVLAVEGGLRVGQAAIAAGLADALGSEEGTLTQLHQEAAARRARPASTLRQLAAPTEEIVAMSNPNARGFWAALFGGATDAGLVAPAAAEDDAPAPAAVAESGAPAVEQVAELERLRAALAERDAAAAAALVEQRATAATAFADTMIREQRATPAERDAIIAAHEAAAGAGGTVLAAIETAYRARPAHSLTSETVPASAAGVLPVARPASGDDAPVSAEDVAALLALTPLGKAVLAAKQAK